MTFNACTRWNAVEMSRAAVWLRHRVGRCLSAVGCRIGYAAWRTCRRKPILSFVVCHWANTRTRGFPIPTPQWCSSPFPPHSASKISHLSRDAPSNHQTDQAPRSGIGCILHVSIQGDSSRKHKPDLFPIFLCALASWVSFLSRIDGGRECLQAKTCRRRFWSHFALYDPLVCC